MIAGVASLGCAAQAATQINFDFDWRFHLGDVPEAAAASFDDKAWRLVDLPHDFGIEGPFQQALPGETGKLPWFGIVWYRKHFDLPAEDAGRQIYLDVDGAMACSTVCAWATMRTSSSTARTLAMPARKIAWLSARMIFSI